MVLEYILLLPSTTMYIKTCGIDLIDLEAYNAFSLYKSLY
jgi:hypothetical protein